MNICYVSSEVAPFSKTGGLADVSGALPRYLHGRGHDVRVFTPLYSQIDPTGHDFDRVEALTDVPIGIGQRTFRFTAFTASLPGSITPVFFIDCPPLFHRPYIYTAGGDEHLRFALLSRAAIECCQRLGWSPAIFHCNDWHTGLIPLLLQTVYSWDALFHRTRTLLTIHNIAYQGIFPDVVIPELGLDWSRHLFFNEDLRKGIINYLKTGIVYADAISAVSRTYAKEIQTEALGAGLDAVLRERSENIVGIVNGVDYGEWDPSRDPHIPFRYSVKNLAAKGKNKKALLEAMGLRNAPRVPVLGIVSRLIRQKGIELLMDALPEQLARRDVRVVALGSGEERFETFFSRLQASFPGRAAFYRGFSNELAHLIEAGSDIFLMPSLYEPCGLNQMYSLKYGTVPVVRNTGGLADTVRSYDPRTGEGTGFVFDHFSADGLRWALNAALEIHANRTAWRRIMLNGMSEDWSWDVQVGHYLDLYTRLAGQ